LTLISPRSFSRTVSFVCEDEYQQYLSGLNFIALKMLIADRAKYIGIIIGLTFASLVITQQSAICLCIFDGSL
jgi:hypothetical protein